MAAEKLNHLALSDNGFLFDSSTGHTYNLNGPGTAMLKMILAGNEEADIAAGIAEQFEVSPEVALRDLEGFRRALVELGLAQS